MRVSFLWTSMLVLIGLMIVAPPGADAQIVVHDPAIEFVLEEEPVAHAWGASTKTMVTAGFTGNGQNLGTVGMYFGSTGNDGTPNQGAIHSWNWRVFFYESQEALELNPQNPTVSLSFGSPTNPGWSNPLFQLDTPAGNFNIMYAEVDVSSFGISTMLGELQYATLIPEPFTGQGGAVLPLTLGNGIGEDNWAYASFPWGPAPLFDLVGRDHATIRVTTIPGPATLGCLGLGGLVLAKSRRRRCVSTSASPALSKRIP